MQPTKRAAGRGKAREEAVHIWLVRGVLSAVGAIVLGIVSSWIYELIQKRNDHDHPIPPRIDSGKAEPNDSARLPLVQRWGLIEVTSTQCQAWVLDSPDDEHPRMLGPQRFASSLGTLTIKMGENPSLQFKPDDEEVVKKCVGKFFQKLTDTEKVPRDRIFIVAGGFLSPDVLADTGSARALLKNAVKEATNGASLDILKLKTEVQLKFDHLIPPKSKDRYHAYLLDIGSDTIRVGWIEQDDGLDRELIDRFEYLFYPHLNGQPGDLPDKKIRTCVGFDLKNYSTLGALRKIYCVPSRQEAEGKVPGRLLPEDKTTVDKEGGNSFWPRLCIAELRKQRR